MASDHSGFSAHSVFERLEPRRHFCSALHDDPGAAIAPLASLATDVVAPLADVADVTPPTLIAVRIEGTPRDTTAVVLTFSESLDPVRAQRISNYRISRTRTECESDLFPDADPFDDEVCYDERQSVKLDGAIYDDATHTVTLVPRDSFKASVRMRRLRVSADAENGVTDLAGNRLDGNDNGTPGGRGEWKMRFSEGRSVSYKEEDGDRVKLRVSGPGKTSVLRRLDDDGHMIGGAEQVFLTGERSAATVLSGTVTPGRNGNGVATIGVLSNVDGATVAIAQDPAFVIGSVEE